MSTVAAIGAERQTGGVETGQLAGRDKLELLPVAHSAHRTGSHHGSVHDETWASDNEADLSECRISSSAEEAFQDIRKDSCVASA